MTAIPIVMDTFGEKRLRRKRLRRRRRIIMLVITLIALAVLAPRMGREISLMLHGGHSPDATSLSITIASTQLAIPGNMIRYEHERRQDTLDRIHLYFDWPIMQGYRAAARSTFNNTPVDQEQNIIFATIEPHFTMLDMSGRYEPMYSRMIENGSIEGVRQIRMHRFLQKHSEYAQEVLIVADRPNRMPFVALCLKGAWAREALTSCTRDVHVTDKLSISYQFSNAMLGRWPEMENAVLRTAFSFLPMKELGLR